MNPPFVVDASVAIAWIVPSQASRVADELLDQVAAGRGIVVPPLWPYEVGNSLIMLLRRKKLTNEEYVSARILIAGLGASIDDDGIRFAGTQVPDLAVEHELTAYDAAYLELAIRKQLPLASRDADLNRAARRCDVNLLL